MKKVCRLLPSSFSSCHFRSLPDVAESSITITKSSSQNINVNSFKKPTPLLTRRHSSDPPPVSTPVKKMEMGKLGSTGGVVCANHSSSSHSHSGLFTSSDDKTRDDFDFSLSSNSGDSFRLKTCSRRPRQDQMKSIDEVGPETRKIKKTSLPEHEERVGSDHAFTQLYYQNSRRRSSKSSHVRRRKVMKKELGGPMIGESYAVEKSSSDPGGDFRASMVEMIVEKQLFGSEDLERLLLCFLSLNAVSYHGIIYHVFSEICQTLFAN